MADEKNIVITSPLYEERIEFDQKSAIYRILFLIFEGVVVLSIVLFIVMYLITDVKQFMRVSSILVSLQIPIHMVKTQYIRNKLLYFIPMCLLGVSAGIGAYYFIYGFEYIQLLDYVYITIIACLMIVVYVIVLIVNLKRFKQERISEILKDSKD